MSVNDKLTHMGFSKQELRIVLFLCIGFCVGFFFWLYRNYLQPLPEVASVTFSDPVVELESKNVFLEELKIDLNSSDQTQLEKLPGIGPSKAQKIIQYREQNGGFKSIDELMSVSGIGEKTLSEVKPYLYIE